MVSAKAESCLQTVDNEAECPSPCNMFKSFVDPDI